MLSGLSGRALLIDPRELLDIGIANCLDIGSFEVIGQELNLDTAWSKLEMAAPDLVLIGPNVPEAEAFRSCRQIHDQWPNIHVILVHGEAKDPLVQVDAIDAGAAACLPANIRCQTQVAVLTSIVAGHEPIGRRQAYRADQPAKLTHREHETLLRLASGATYSEIATSMELATATVRNCAQRILEKLQVNSRDAAVRRARRRRII